MPRVSRSRSYNNHSRRRRSSRSPYKKKNFSKYHYKTYLKTTSLFKSFKYMPHSSSHSPSPTSFYSKRKGKSPTQPYEKSYRQSRRQRKDSQRKDQSYNKRFSKQFPYLKQESFGGQNTPRKYEERKSNVWMKSQREDSNTLCSQQQDLNSNQLIHPYSHKQYSNQNSLQSDFTTYSQRRHQYEPPRLEITPIEKTESLNHAMIPGLSSTYIQAVPDSQKYKTKIYLPRNTGINYVGLLIGPKGIYQKKLEEQTGCKILIRGRGSHKEGHPMQFDDIEDQHVLIIGETEDKIYKARATVHRVLTADEETRNAIRSDQLKAAQEMSKDIYRVQPEDYLLTPYGPPSPNAYIIPVPNECVGLIIGKGGETIRTLQMKSGSKIQVAKKEIPTTSMRNVFIEATPEKFEGAKHLIEDIVNEHRRIQENFQQIGEVNPFPGPYHYFPIPNSLTDVVIGQNGSTIKSIYQKTGCYIFIPKEVGSNNERVLQLSGTLDQIERCKLELMQILKNVRNYAESTGQSLTQSKSAQYAPQGEVIGKKGLIEEAIREQQLLLPSDLAFYSSDIKEEPQPDQKSQSYGSYSQRDFLFDPYAAAYYERFSMFQPGQSLNFNEIQWSTLNKQRLQHPKTYKTFYQVYFEHYGERLGRIQLENEFSNLSTHIPSYDQCNQMNQLPFTNLNQDSFFAQENFYSNQQQQQFYNQIPVNSQSCMSQMQYNNVYLESSMVNAEQNSLGQLQGQFQQRGSVSQQVGQENLSALSLYYQCFGGQNMVNKEQQEVGQTQQMSFSNIVERKGNEQEKEPIRSSVQKIQKMFEITRVENQRQRTSNEFQRSQNNQKDQQDELQDTEDEDNEHVPLKVTL